MNTFTRALGTILAVAVLIAFGWGLYLVASWILGAFNGIDAQLDGPLVAAWGSVLIASVIVGLILRWSRRRELRYDVQSKKEEVYLQLLEAWSSHVDRAAKNGEAPNPSDLAAAERRLILRGGVAVIRRYEAARSAQAEYGHESDDARAAADRLMKAMRTDVGEGTLGLSTGKLAEIFLDDAWEDGSISRLSNVKASPSTGARVGADEAAPDAPAHGKA